jgi:hypothetical protein
LLGNWESISIKARPNPFAKWSEIPRVVKERAYYSAGASPHHIHTLWSGDELLPKIEPYERLTPRDPKVPQPSFFVDLTDFAWPREWTGMIDVVARQSLGRDGSEGTWQGTLESAPVLVSVKDLKWDATQ